jgi:hypothetical protein
MTTIPLRLPGLSGRNSRTPHHVLGSRVHPVAPGEATAAAHNENDVGRRATDIGLRDANRYAAHRGSAAT